MREAKQMLPELKIEHFVVGVRFSFSFSSKLVQFEVDRDFFEANFISFIRGWTKFDSTVDGSMCEAKQMLLELKIEHFVVGVRFSFSFSSKLVQFEVDRDFFEANFISFIRGWTKFDSTADDSMREATQMFFSKEKMS